MECTWSSANRKQKDIRLKILTSLKVVQLISKIFIQLYSSSEIALSIVLLSNWRIKKAVKLKKDCLNEIKGFLQSVFFIVYILL